MMIPFSLPEHAGSEALDRIRQFKKLLKPITPAMPAWPDRKEKDDMRSKTMLRGTAK
jgi:hypothetical protein